MMHDGSFLGSESKFEAKWIGKNLEASRSWSQLQVFSLPWLLLQTKYGAYHTRIQVDYAPGAHPIPKAVSIGQNRKIVAKQLANGGASNVYDK